MQDIIIRSLSLTGNCMQSEGELRFCISLYEIFRDVRIRILINVRSQFLRTAYISASQTFTLKTHSLSNPNKGRTTAKVSRIRTKLIWWIHPWTLITKMGRSGPAPKSGRGQVGVKVEHFHDLTPLRGYKENFFAIKDFRKI